MSVDLHADLNARQREAVEYRDGPLAVLAGPGTGKTRVIIHRIARLIEDDGVQPETVLAVTFTVRAAEDLRSRLAGLVGAAKADRVQAGTFHGFARRLVMRNRDLLGMVREPQLADSAQQRRILREIVRGANLRDHLVARGWTAIIDETLELIGRLLHSAITPEEFAQKVSERRTAIDAGELDLDDVEMNAERARVEELEQQAVLYSRYAEAMRERSLTTFDDDIAHCLELLRNRANVAAMVRADCRHVLVDEFQDVNRAQIELLRLIAPACSRPDLCVVGDDDQSIYLFRGADDRAFHQFAQAWPEHRVVALEENYRSAAAIVEAANRVIVRASARFAPKKTIVSCVDPAERVGAAAECVLVPGEEHDGPVIASMLRKARAEAPERAWKRYAVIARTHRDLSRVAAALELEGVPSVQARKPSPMHDDGVKDLLAWVELLLEPTQHAIAARLLRRPPISIEVERIADAMREYRGALWRSESGDGAHPGAFIPWLVAQYPSDHRVARLGRLWTEFFEVATHDAADRVLWRIATRAELAHAELLPERERARRVMSLVDVLRFARERQSQLDPPGDLRTFYDYFSDLDGPDKDRLGESLDREASPGEEAMFEDVDGVRLLTAHAAKGLEFDTVFVPRVNPGHGYPSTSGSAPEELPDWLADRAGDARRTKERFLDEERRLFYVACTRAERRLVILTKETKSPSKSTHFAQELMGEPAGASDPIVIVRRAHEVAAMGGDQALSASLAGGEATDRLAERIARIRRGARLDAAVALDMADSVDVEPSRLGAIEQVMRRAALRLALAAHVECRRDLPRWAREHDADLGVDLEELEAVIVEKSHPSSGFAFPPLRAPLRLSYSAINDYLLCPRCFYVKRELRLWDEPSEAMAIGTAAHEALRLFYERWRESDAEGLRPPEADTLLSLARDVFSRAAGGMPAPGSIEQLQAILRQFYERMHDPMANILHLEETVRFPYVHAGVNHTIEAKLDRVDQVGGGFRIIDYKTGHPKKDLLEPPKDDLQLGMYAMALPALLGEEWGAHKGTAEYWVLQTCEKGAIDLGAIRLDKIRAKIDRAIEGMLAGRWGRGSQCRGACDLLGPE